MKWRVIFSTITEKCLPIYTGAPPIASKSCMNISKSLSHEGSATESPRIQWNLIRKEKVDARFSFARLANNKNG